MLCLKGRKRFSAAQVILSGKNVFVIIIYHVFYLGAEWNHFNQIFWNLSALLLKVSNISGMFVNSILNCS